MKWQLKSPVATRGYWGKARLCMVSIMRRPCPNQPSVVGVVVVPVSVVVVKMLPSQAVVKERPTHVAPGDDTSESVVRPESLTLKRSALYRIVLTMSPPPETAA